MTLLYLTSHKLSKTEAYMGLWSTLPQKCRQIQTIISVTWCLDTGCLVEPRVTYMQDLLISFVITCLIDKPPRYGLFRLYWIDHVPLKEPVGDTLISILIIRSSLIFSDIARPLFLPLISQLLDLGSSAKANLGCYYTLSNSGNNLNLFYHLNKIFLKNYQWFN